MQLSKVTAFWLRLAGNVLLDLFLYAHMFCPPRCAHEIIRRLILLPLEGRHTPDHDSVVVCGSPSCFLGGYSSYNQKPLLAGKVDGVSPNEEVSRQTTRGCVQKRF